MKTSLFLVSVLFVFVGTGLVEAEDIAFDFRGKKMAEDLFNYSPNKDTCLQFMKFEEEGLRITWSAENRPREAIALYWKCRVRGDFEANLHFELLSADPTTYGTGVELYLMSENENRDGLPFTKQMRPAQINLPLLAKNEMNWVVQRRTGPNNPKERRTEGHQMKKADPDQTKGRLKIERQGDTVTASFAEGDEGKFEVLQTYTIPQDIDFRMVRIGGLASGNQPAALDMRIFDTQLKGDLGGLQAARANPVAVGPDGVPAPPKNPSQRTALWVVIILGMISLVIFLGVFTLIRRKKSREKAPEEPGNAKEPSGEEVNSAASAAPKTDGEPIRLACASCGKKLKVNDTYAGKRIKCPQCSAEMRVPLK